MAFRLIQTEFTGQPSVVLLQQGLWNDFRGSEHISSASCCDVKQVRGRERKAKELKNKCDYFESYWFRPSKVVETSWKTPAITQLKLQQWTEPNTNTNNYIQTHTYRNTIKLYIDPPNSLWGTCTPLSVNLLQLFQTLLHSGLSQASPVKSMPSWTEIWLETPGAVVIPSCSESQTHFSQS